MTVDLSDLKSLVNPVYYPLLKDRTPTLILFGGSSSGKSYFLAQRIVINTLQGENTLVIRKVDSTLKDSVYPLIKSVISEWGLTTLFSINKSDKTITCNNSYQIIFRGLQDPERIKSITCEKGLITSIFVEEATELSIDDYKQLSLRMRGRSSVKKQMVLAFNPISINHWIKKRFFDKCSDSVKIVKTTYKDNAYLSEEDIDRIESLRDIDEVYYNIYALGDWGSLGNLVYSNWSTADLEEQIDTFDHYFYGIDFGFNHPFSCVKVAMKDDVIYILDEIYEKGKTNTEMIDLIKPMVGGSMVLCDSAEPRSIKEFYDNGINAVGVKKGADSVKHGIQWIKQHKIIVNSVRCPNVINELGLYKYRQDKNGIIYEEPVDANDDALDAFRYALNHKIKNNIIEVSDIDADFFGL